MPVETHPHFLGDNMTVYGVITAAIVRKVKALVAEYRKIVAEATAVEKKIVSEAYTEAHNVIEEARALEASIVSRAEAETEKLKNELINKIAAL
jgi:vacuolar-type H+-ATPase subunit H